MSSAPYFSFRTDFDFVFHNAIIGVDVGVRVDGKNIIRRRERFVKSVVIKLNYFLLKKNGISKDGVTKFAYRDDGYFGNVKATYGTNNANYAIVPYVRAYSVMHSYFKPERCVTCIDHFAYLADISLGDINCESYNKDTIGSNSVIIRTDCAKNVFDELMKNKKIEATVIPVSEVIRSQKIINFRKTLFNGCSFMYHLGLRYVPKYDLLPNKKLEIKSIFLFLSYKMQRFISRLWKIK